MAGIERQALESDYLQEVDSRAAHVLHKMEDTGLKNLTDEDQPSLPTSLRHQQPLEFL